MDENVKMSDEDIEKLKSCDIVNSTDIFKKGTPDEKLTWRAKKEGWVIVTKDIRMTLRSLKDHVPVIFISDDLKTVEYITAKNHGRRKFPEMFDYIYERFGFDNINNRKK